MTNGTRPRWMVVDDDADTLEALGSLLAAVSDAEICSFQSPWEAVNAFAAAPETFHLVVTDFDMPRMNGVDLRRPLHALSPSLKILLITGGGLFAEETALRNGFFGLLQKPFSIGGLRQALVYAGVPAVIRSGSSDTI